MNIPFIRGGLCRLSAKLTTLAASCAAFLFFAADRAGAQTTNAYDVASDPAYSGDGPGNGLGNAGHPNGGFGFGPWTFTILNNGGAFINGAGPSGASFDLWNVSANSSTIAARPFGSPLAVGQSFSVQLRLNSLDNAGTTNALILEDASGNALFSYWHVGFEPNGAVNGSYADATTNHGVAAGFSYNYQQFCKFTFTLNSATTYTFTDNTTGYSFSGVIAGTIAQTAFFRGSLGATGNGQDFQFDVLSIASAIPPSFVAQKPPPGSYGGSRTNLSVGVVAGSSPINPGSIGMTVDGSAVSPTVTTALGATTISYVPAAPLASGTFHTVQVTLADNTATAYTNSWSFTTGFAALPASVPGPVVASDSEAGVIAFSAAGDAWLGTNYGPASSKTIYARFSMEFDNLNGETGGGGGYGGLHFFRGGTGHLIVGNNWASLNWSADPSDGPPQLDLNPVTPIVFGEWHTLVERIDFSPGANATVNVWLDPDLGQTEAAQPNSPVTFSLDDTFDTVLLRTGNGTTSATFSNIVMSAVSPFLAPASPQFLNLVPGANAASAALTTPISAEAIFGTYAINSNNVSLTLDGNPVTPAFAVSATSITVNYQPPAPLAAGSAHTVLLSVTDENGGAYATNWAFTVDAYPALPVTVAGPIDVIYSIDGSLGVQIFNSQNGWIGGNYQASSTNTLYATFSMEFFDLNGEGADDAGGCYGGLHFYQGGAERLLTGETWLRNTWSIDDKTGGEGGELSLPPATVVAVNEIHTMAVKSVYHANDATAVTIWLDPDFTKSEANQPNPPLNVSMDNTFDNVRLRCGNGSAAAEYSNITMAATSPFAPVLTLQSAGGAVTLSWTGSGVLQRAPAVTGPWSDAETQANPQSVLTTNAASFYRLKR